MGSGATKPKQQSNGEVISVKVCSNLSLQTHYQPLQEAPEGWPIDGRFFPLGPGSKAKAEWTPFWTMVAASKACLMSVEVEPAGAMLSAAQVVRAQKNNLTTTVLATVMCPGWSLTWASAVLNTVVMPASSCGTLTLIAIKGGPACDEEVAFIQVLMMELGFTLIRNGDNRGTSLLWEWKLQRKSAGAYKVKLRQFYSLDGTSALPESFAPKQRNSVAPNLKRLAIVSCAESWPPINGVSQRLNLDSQLVKHVLDVKRETGNLRPDEELQLQTIGVTVNDVLNAYIIQALDKTEQRAALKGFAPDADWHSSEEANTVYRAYFDKPYKSLTALAREPSFSWLEASETLEGFAQYELRPCSHRA